MVQSLSGYKDDSNVDADYIGIKTPKHVLGKQWQNVFVAKAANVGIERVLL